jgi:hypothetical protein
MQNQFLFFLGEIGFFGLFGEPKLSQSQNHLIYLKRAITKWLIDFDLRKGVHDNVRQQLD